jgi:Tfp pilus assembly protein PilF
MRTRQSRQYLLLLTLWFTGAGNGWSQESRPVETVDQELQAAVLIETAVLAKGASAQDLLKLGKIFKDLASKHPRSVEVRNRRAEFLWTIGEKDQAEEEWKVAERLDPANATVLNHLGNFALDTGAVRQSANYYERAVKAAPEQAIYHFNLANVLLMFRKELLNPEQKTAEAVSAEALRQYAEAARLAPANEEYLRGYGETFFLIPNPDWHAALLAWTNIMEVTAHKDLALSNLARIHLTLGDKEQARACLEKIEGSEFARIKAQLKLQIEQKPDSQPSKN